MDWPYLTKLVLMTGSAHDGEAVAAIRKATEYLTKNGLDWTKVLALAAKSAKRDAPPRTIDPTDRVGIQYVFNTIFDAGPVDRDFDKLMQAMYLEWLFLGRLSDKQQASLIAALELVKRRTTTT